MRLAALGFLLLPVLSIPAQAGYWDELECNWQRDRPGINASIDSASALLQFRCDAQLHAQTYRRFQFLDRVSLAQYNRGIVTTSSPATRRLAAEAVVLTVPSR